ncbi:hypothetical protein [Streptomyces sp. x-80]|uniref:hypothetical protein n=1 Tax=Streptomyces sp. x-80 TaxID=2789282 RepID=UPI00398014B7
MACAATAAIASAVFIGAQQTTASAATAADSAGAPRAIAGTAQEQRSSPASADEQVCIPTVARPA